MQRPLITSVVPMRLFGQPIPMVLVKSGDHKMATLYVKGGKFKIREGKLTLPERARVSARLN